MVQKRPEEWPDVFECNTFHHCMKHVTCNEGGGEGEGADVMPGQKLSLSLRLLHFKLLQLQTPRPSLQYQDLALQSLSGS